MICGFLCQPLSFNIFSSFISELVHHFMASLIAQLVRNPPAVPDPGSIPGVWKIPWRRDRLPTPVFSGFPCGSAGEEPACNAGDLGSIPGLGRSPREGKGYLLQYSGLENSMVCIVHRVAKSCTQLSDFHFHTDFHCYQKSNSYCVPIFKVSLPPFFPISIRHVSRVHLPWDIIPQGSVQ